MSEQYDNTNSFVLFKNNKKETENHPDFTGKITLEDGTEKRLACWVRESKNGNKFYSGKMSDFQEQSEQTQSTTAKASSEDDLQF